MKTNPQADDAKLTALLRQSHPASLPSLPPRFQENVWRRIEDAEAPTSSGSWLNALATSVLQPRFACLTAVVLVLAGAVLGAYQGTHAARHDARTQYIATVMPPILR